MVTIRTSAISHRAIVALLQGEARRSDNEETPPWRTTSLVRSSTTGSRCRARGVAKTDQQPSMAAPSGCGNAFP